MKSRRRREDEEDAVSEEMPWCCFLKQDSIQSWKADQVNRAWDEWIRYRSISLKVYVTGNLSFYFSLACYVWKAISRLRKELGRVLNFVKSIMCFNNVFSINACIFKSCKIFSDLKCSWTLILNYLLKIYISFKETSKHFSWNWLRMKLDLTPFPNSEVLFILGGLSRLTYAKEPWHWALYLSLSDLKNLVLSNKLIKVQLPPWKTFLCSTSWLAVPS